MKISPYLPEVEAQMLNFSRSLSEKDRRRYAAIEASKLGRGGVTYICRILQCDDRTISRGRQELMTDLSNESTRIRQPGGGRKAVITEPEGLNEAFLAVIADHTAGSPMDETIKWTNLSRPAIAEQLGEKGFAVSVTVVDQLLETHDFRPRQAFRAEAGKQHIPYRDEQFEKIASLRKAYTDAGNPVLSMDVKKRVDR